MAKRIREFNVKVLAPPCFLHRRFRSDLREDAEIEENPRRSDVTGDHGYVAPGKGSSDGTEIFDLHTHALLGVIGSTEDMISIEFVDGKISRVGDQFGIGRR